MKTHQRKRIYVQVADPLYNDLDALVSMGYGSSRGAILKDLLQELSPVVSDLRKAMVKVTAAPVHAKRDLQLFLGESIKQAQSTIDDARENFIDES